MEYEYEGNVFEVKEQKYWYDKNKSLMISDIKKYVGTVVIPERINGLDVTKIQLSDSFYGKKGIYKDVISLSIPASVNSICVDNNQFPDLQRLSVDLANAEYFSDGKLLYREQGKTLYRCLVDGDGVLEIPEIVAKIERYALAYLHYKDLVFHCKQCHLENDVFLDSVWMANQKGGIVIGNLLYRAEKTTEYIVPKQVRRFQEGCFSKCGIKKLITHMLPGYKELEVLEKNGCRHIEITSKKCEISVRALLKMQFLAEIIVVSNHFKFKTMEGVLFSRDGKTLLCYPKGKVSDSYIVPSGTVRIGAMAFQHQPYLKSVVLPNSIKQIDMAAFMDCTKLQQINLPIGITELPDSNVYMRGGVFQKCKSLKKIILPEKMKYVGSYSFYETGLNEVCLNSKLETIGEYAFAGTALETVVLPESVRHLGKGSLEGVGRIDAYEGTARGLIGAVNNAPPYEKQSISNVHWSGCTVMVHSKKNQEITRFLIPGSLKLDSAYHLDLAWNHDGGIDYEEYDACFSDVRDSSERMEMAKDGLMRTKGREDSVFYDYMRNVSYRIASSLLEEKKEKEFLVFLKQDFLSDSSLKKLLKKSNELGMTTVSAYIMERTRSTKKNSFRL